LQQKIRNSNTESESDDNSESDDDIKITKKMAIDMANEIIEKQKESEAPKLTK
jgi:hypothetical protein